MARRFLIALGLSILSLGAPAAERAELDLIGYSPDGRYFAFEEFGIQDGSGFAYSSVYVVDLAEDDWAAGPFRRQAPDEITTLATIRDEALEDATEALGALDVLHPAVLIAMNGDGETGADGLSLDFGVPGYSDPGHVFGSYRLSLEIFKAPSPLDCIAYLGDDPMGFGLILGSDDFDREIYRDAAIPGSRGCPTTYRIHAVAVPYQSYDLAHAVALISVYAFGFEGVDRRFVAVPLTLPGP
ncbi:MAG: DUF2259 domain-containing protein [Cucumibacter sp.]